MNKVSLKTGSTYILGVGYEGFVSLNGLQIWKTEIQTNHYQAELLANDKVLTIFKELFNG